MASLGLAVNRPLTLIRRHLPEGFIWEVFYYLLDAAEAMANGAPKNAAKNSKSKGDFQIVHRDIKPDNSQFHRKCTFVILTEQQSS